MTDAGRLVLNLLWVLTALMACAPALRAQTPDAAQVELPLVLSTTPMTRSADLLLSASIASTFVSDAGLAKVSPSLFRAPQPRGRAVRAAKLVLFDAPIVVYFVGLNHEWGHQASADEYGVRSHLSFTGSPWSGHPFRLIGNAIPPEPPAAAVVHGGGLEASRRLKDRSEARMLRADRVAPGHALAAIVASLDAPLYAFYDLSEERFSREFLGDVLTLVRDLADRRAVHNGAGLERVRHQVRTRMVLNLLDTALWSETYGLIADHVWAGDPSVRIRWFHAGRVDVLPSLRYELSPFGPEYYVGTLFRGSGARGSAYGRWTERIGDDRQVGAGVALSRWTMWRITPRVTVDGWSHTADGFGMHAGVEADVNGWPGRRAALTIGAGAKSAGHLVGYSLEGGAYGTVGITVRVR
jgi:hypothetical protein